MCVTVWLCFLVERNCVRVCDSVCVCVFCMSERLCLKVCDAWQAVDVEGLHSDHCPAVHDGTT